MGKVQFHLLIYSLSFMSGAHHGWVGETFSVAMAVKEWHCFPVTKGFFIFIILSMKESNFAWRHDNYTFDTTAVCWHGLKPAISFILWFLANLKYFCMFEFFFFPGVKTLVPESSGTNANNIKTTTVTNLIPQSSMAITSEVFEKDSS